MIRQASVSDLQKIQSFIEKHWRKDHILTKDLKLFKYLYSFPESDDLNFLLYENNDDQLLGILGYIIASQFDSKIPPSANIVWYSIWKAIESKSNKLIGLRLMSELSKKYKTIKRGTVGANISTLPIYKALGYNTGSLSTFYAVNTNKINFAIIKFKNVSLIVDKPIKANSSNCSIRLIRCLEQLKAYAEWTNNLAKSNHSFKTFDYIQNRYVNHPHFKYQFWELKSLGSKLLIVFREVFYHSSSLLRIVDYIGDTCLFQDFDENLRSRVIGSSEYIEFRCTDLHYELGCAGFCKLDPMQGTVIPGYYDPMVFKNIEIHWSLLSGFETLPCKDIIVVGDCDQDRPNTYISEQV